MEKDSINTKGVKMSKNFKIDLYVLLGGFIIGISTGCAITGWLILK